MNNIQDILNNIGKSEILNSTGPRLANLIKQKTIYQYDVNGNLIGTISNMKEAKKLGFKSIGNALTKHHICNGFYFSYTPIKDFESWKPTRSLSDDIKIIDVYNKDGQYLMTTDREVFQEQYGIRSSSLSTCLSGRNKSCKGFLVRKSVSNPPTNIKPHKKNSRSEMVGKFTTDGVLLGRYNSLRECAKENGLTHTTLTRWIQNNYVSPNGIIFKKVFAGKIESPNFV